MSAVAEVATGRIVDEAPAPLARIEDLTVEFRRHGLTAVRGLSLELAAGRCAALVGESGSGKSVTARSLIGLNGREATVTATRLEFDGIDLTAVGEREWRRIRGGGIGYVLQDALVSLDPLRRIGQEVGEAIKVHRRLPAKERRAEVLRLLSSVGIPDPVVRAAQRSNQLSGGLRQRALIASALSGLPGLLIADEPTTALDVTVQAQILDLLGRLRSEGTGLLLVSHDLAVVGSIADEILVMQAGEVVERGTPDEVLLDPKHPYTKQLLAAVPSAHSRGERLSATGPIRVVEPQPARNATATVLEARSLTKSYALPGGGRRLVVEDVSFELRAGETLGIVGESGSGKSTTADIVLALTEPDHGEVLLDGEPWTTVPERRRRARRAHIQPITQDPLSSFDPRADVAQIVDEALAAVGVPRAERRDRSVGLLEQVGLAPEHLGRHPLELSGGQRQRIAIARALATGPSIIVADEPVSALDVSIQAQVLDLLTELQRATGVALLFISHDLGVVQHLADRVLVMEDGRVVESGAIDDVFQRPAHDYTRRLLASIPRLPER